MSDVSSPNQVSQAAGQPGADDAASNHLPVLVEDVVALCGSIPAGGLLVDGMVGLGGHAEAVCRRFPQIRVLGIDKDADALTQAAARLAPWVDRVCLVRGSTAHIVESWRVSSNGEGFDPAVSTRDVVLGTPEASHVSSASFFFDLGVSSLQLDRGERGFSYRLDGPLDMRMDQRQSASAATVVNEYDEAQLSAVLARYGDERFARRVARAVVKARPLHSTLDLARVVTEAIPAATRRTGGHPARRSFQAIRMEVNAERAELESMLAAALDLAEPDGLVIVLTYHSGEDRIVKHALAQAVSGGCECPPGLPCGCGARRRARWCVRRRHPSAEEQAGNPRARSATLRAVQLTAVVP